jgi:class 3 adenylate cyclase
MKTAASLRAAFCVKLKLRAPNTLNRLGGFTLRDIGRHEVKGFAEPVEAWAVEGASASEDRFESVRSGRLTGFVGREYEIGLLIER